MTELNISQAGRERLRQFLETESGKEVYEILVNGTPVPSMNQHAHVMQFTSGVTRGWMECCDFIIGLSKPKEQASKPITGDSESVFLEDLKRELNPDNE